MFINDGDRLTMDTQVNAPRILFVMNMSKTMTKKILKWDIDLHIFHQQWGLTVMTHFGTQLGLCSLKGSVLNSCCKSCDTSGWYIEEFSPYHSLVLEDYPLNFFHGKNFEMHLRYILFFSKYPQVFQVCCQLLPKCT